MAYETIIESIAQQENFTSFAFSGEDIFVIANRVRVQMREQPLLMVALGLRRSMF